MEKRVAKVNISSAGGTAAQGASTCKITLPNMWMKAMGVAPGRRELSLAFDGKQIILSRCFTGEDFVAQKLEMGHDVRLFWFYDGDELCTTIRADFTDDSLTVENHVFDPVKTAFGNCEQPTWEAFQDFLEERCVPRQRAGLQDYLEVIGVGGYDPLEIIQKTAGRMAEDGHRLEMERLK